MVCWSNWTTLELFYIGHLIFLSLPRLWLLFYSHEIHVHTLEALLNKLASNFHRALSTIWIRKRYWIKSFNLLSVMLLPCLSSSPPLPRAFLCEESEHFLLKVKCKAQEDAFARLRWERSSCKHSPSKCSYICAALLSAWAFAGKRLVKSSPWTKIIQSAECTREYQMCSPPPIRWGSLLWYLCPSVSWNCLKGFSVLRVSCQFECQEMSPLCEIN